MERRQDEEFGGTAVDDLLHLLLHRCDVVDHGARGVDRDGESRPVVQVEQPSVLVVANSVQQDIQVMNCSLRNVGREDKIMRQTSFLVNFKPYCFLYVHVIRNNTLFTLWYIPFALKHHLFSNLYLHRQLGRLLVQVVVGREAGRGRVLVDPSFCRHRGAVVQDAAVAALASCGEGKWLSLMLSVIS